MKKESVREHIANYLDTLLEELNVEFASKLEGTVMQCSDINNVDSYSHQFQVINDEQCVKLVLTHYLKRENVCKKFKLLKLLKYRKEHC